MYVTRCPMDVLTDHCMLAGPVSCQRAGAAPFNSAVCSRKHVVSQKPSYTEQAKQYTAKGADMLHGGAEVLKGKLVGTGAPGVTLFPYLCCLNLS